MMKNSEQEETIFTFDLKEWESYPVGTYKKNTASVEEGVVATLERINRIVPSIKKSSKLLIFSSGSVYIPIYLCSKYGCKIELVVNEESKVNRLEKEVRAVGLDEKINVSHKLFYKTLFLNNTFDMVWSIAENYQDDRALEIFRETARVLVPEGRYIMCHLFRTSDSVMPPFDHLGVIDLFLKKASSADLERVYVRKMIPESKAHYKMLKSELNKEDLVLPYKEAVADEAITWGLLVFQKRNT